MSNNLLTSAAILLCTATTAAAQGFTGASIGFDYNGYSSDVDVLNSSELTG